MMKTSVLLVVVAWGAPAMAGQVFVFSNAMLPIPTGEVVDFGFVAERVAGDPQPLVLSVEGLVVPSPPDGSLVTHWVVTESNAAEFGVDWSAWDAALDDYETLGAEFTFGDQVVDSLFQVSPPSRQQVDLQQILVAVGWTPYNPVVNDANWRIMATGRDPSTPDIPEPVTGWLAAGGVWMLTDRRFLLLGPRHYGRSGHSNRHQR